MGIFDSSSPGISVALDVPWPANVVSGPGVQINKMNATWAVGLDYPDLTEETSLVTPSNAYLAIYDTGLVAYTKIRADNFIAGATGLDARTPRGDADYSILITDRYIGLTATLTAVRTFTLPAASTVPGGRLVVIQDEVGGISAAFHNLFVPTGADTIDGLSTWRNKTKFGAVAFRSNGSNAWNVVAAGQFTAVADTAYTATQGDSVVAYTSISAARAVALPAASVFPSGQRLTVIDFSGSCSGTNTITLNRASADTINGATSKVISLAFGYLAIISDGVSKWTVVDSLSIAGLPISGSAITTSTIDSTAIATSTVNSSTIGATTPSTGVFTTLSATSLSLTSGGFKVGGRLTLSSGIPVLTTPGVSAAATVYFTPYDGDLIPLWNGSQFVWTSVTELSNVLANSATGNAGPAAAVASKVYDLYVWSNSGTPTLTRSPKWDDGTAGSNTARGTGAGGSAQTRVNGIITNTVSITNGPGAGAGTYVGTITTDAGGATVTCIPGSSAANGGQAWIGVWNQFNRILAACNVNDTTSTHTYTTATYRSWNNSNTNRITFVVGQLEDGVQANFICYWNSTGATSATSLTGIGLDSTTVLAANAVVAQSSLATISNPVNSQLISTYMGYPGLGLHFLQALERGDGTNANTFVGAGQEAFMAMLRY